MNKSLVAIFLLISAFSFGQDIISKIQNISSVEEANEFLTANPDVKGEIFSFFPETDVNKVSDKFLKTDSIKATFKKIAERKVKMMRVQYIYLDGNKLKLSEIYALQKKIIKEYKDGETFRGLAATYSMDGNKSNGGDLGWFEQGTMVQEFEKEVLSHKLYQIFPVDVPSKNWYYIVLKTYNEKEMQEITVLKVQSST